MANHKCVISCSLCEMVFGSREHHGLDLKAVDQATREDWTIGTIDRQADGLHCP
ncbi:hypothetical protein BS47DRAFT_1343640 [Hydnum rufescens UP504]|uniref:Uncharacterized protein n=1 Tax=Hydnum rufescens UP504 TaxID=1448309 RepID=A0A9P6AXS6_9AGAM|nr:hypothetical protein BS47DRAFT_1343640 [Hydnum rufescens UP504]